MRFIVVFMACVFMAACQPSASDQIASPNSIETADNSPLQKALSRGHGEPVSPSDPKTAKEFWEARDQEIDAILDHVATHDYANAAERLLHMLQIDQTLRFMFSKDEELKSHFESLEEFQSFSQEISPRVVKVDQANTATLKAMLKDRPWFRDDQDGAGSAHLAFVIVQHADRDHEFQIEALAKIKAALGQPGVSKSNYAYLYDRVKANFMNPDPNIKRVQRYGTQGGCNAETGKWEPLALEDLERVDELRAEVGLEPLEAYKARFNC